MKTIDTVDGLLCLSIAVADLLIRDLLIPVAVFALIVAGWQSGAPRSLVAQSPVRSVQVPLLPPAPGPVGLLPPAPAAAPAGLASLPVRELRVLARGAGHRALARSGRRADLLAALA
ncbi:MAG: hypothetical protein FJ083_14520 [Cyanobacteria bacterium K_Offshore_surface_m2_239]|nr:hypothetical protein [Cyanobacteria bacterium K_Offshore_surface_m2_239]